MESKLHSNGPYYTHDGSIYNPFVPQFVMNENASILIDIETGTLLKVGERKIIEPYYLTMCQKCHKIGYTTMTNALQIITFNVKSEPYDFDIDDICTIINWFNNSIGEQMKKFLNNNDQNEIKATIKRLQSLGF